MARVGDVFNVGDKVPHSGIYNVLHDNHHPQKHEVTCIYGRVFPPCRGCTSHVQFKLAFAAHYIKDDPEFKTDSLLMRVPHNPLG